jgi:hypothetical protein
MSEIGSLFAAGTLLSLGGLGLYLYQSNDDDETKENIELKVDDEESGGVVEDEVPVRSKTRKTKVIRRTSKQTSTRRRY